MFEAGGVEVAAGFEAAGGVSGGAAGRLGNSVDAGATGASVCAGAGAEGAVDVTCVAAVCSTAR